MTVFPTAFTVFVASVRSIVFPAYQTISALFGQDSKRWAVGGGWFTRPKGRIGASYAPQVRQTLIVPSTTFPDIFWRRAIRVRDAITIRPLPRLRRHAAYKTGLAGITFAAAADCVELAHMLHIDNGFLYGGKPVSHHRRNRKSGGNEEKEPDGTEDNERCKTFWICCFVWHDHSVPDGTAARHCIKKHPFVQNVGVRMRWAEAV